MSTGNTESSVGLMEPNVLETGCGCLDSSQHPPTCYKGNVPSGKAVIEPIATADDIQSALEWCMEEFEFKGNLERCRSLATLDAPENLLHQKV